MHRDPAEAVWLRSLANSERRRLQSAQTPGMNTETLCSMNYGCNTVSAANAAVSSRRRARPRGEAKELGVAAQGEAQRHRLRGAHRRDERARR